RRLTRPAADDQVQVMEHDIEVIRHRATRDKAPHQKQSHFATHRASLVVLFHVVEKHAVSDPVADGNLSGCDPAAEDHRAARLDLEVANTAIGHRAVIALDGYLTAHVQAANTAVRPL